MLTEKKRKFSAGKGKNYKYSMLVYCVEYIYHMLKNIKTYIRLISKCSRKLKSAFILPNKHINNYCY